MTLMRRYLGVSLAMALLTACGGGGGTTDTANATNPSNATTSVNSTLNAVTPVPLPPRIINTRGALLDGKPLKTHDISANRAAANGAAKQIPALAPVYATTLYRLTYQTVDAQGQLTKASGVLVLPQKPAGSKSPLLSFQHGTIFYDREAPSNDLSATTPHNILASLGYVVAAADYVGYGESRGKAHPYLQREPSAAAVVDFLTAAHQWLAEHRFPLNEQLFLTDYSEGGYVTLAAQQALEAAGVPITASVAGAGPYDLQYTLDQLLSSKAILASTRSALGLRRPEVAAKYPGKFDEALVDTLLYFLIPKNSDIKFDKTFLLDWMADDYVTMRHNSVHDWQARAPTRLTHGRGDNTVPFGNSTRALESMRLRGTPDLDLAECYATPPDHSECIRPYAQFLTDYFRNFARDL
ncbi:MAG: alpha/beta hydrolase family protein [Thiothrix sp.]